MRKKFEKQATYNTRYVNDNMNEFIEDAWKLSEKVNVQMSLCMDLTCDDSKKYLCIIILRNTLTDLLCCLDSLARGHSRTVENNLRMILEDIKLSLFISNNDNCYDKLLDKGLKQNDIQNSLNILKTKYGEEIGDIYGRLSNISHHLKPELLVRQLVKNPTSNIMSFALLKPIQLNIISFYNNLLLISLFLRIVAELAEEISIEYLTTPYFGKLNNGIYKRNLNIPEQLFIESLLKKYKIITNEKK